MQCCLLSSMLHFDEPPLLQRAHRFHTGTMLLSIVPLCIGWPDKAVLPSPSDGALMVGVAVTSFAAQLLGTRGLQLVVAAKAAAMGFTQVRCSSCMFCNRTTVHDGA